MSEPRTFKITKPLMHGSDIENWQREIRDHFESFFGIECPIDIDGYYGGDTRSFTRSLCYALGMDVDKVMAHGVEPGLRTKIRHKDLTDREKHDMAVRGNWRKRLQERYSEMLRPAVARPVKTLIADSWGWHPGVHDGVDVICLPDVPTFAMVKSKIIDVRASGWWGLGAPSDPALRARGDGIVQMEVLEDIGPFKKGHHIGYGHNEKAVVHVGQVVEAGHQVAHAGFANAWHIHLMYNDGSVGTRGVGNLDPQAIVDYAFKHGK